MEQDAHDNFRQIFEEISKSLKSMKSIEKPEGLRVRACAACALVCVCVRVLFVCVCVCVYVWSHCVVQTATGTKRNKSYGYGAQTSPVWTLLVGRGSRRPRVGLFSSRRDFVAHKSVH